MKEYLEAFLITFCVFIFSYFQKKERTVNGDSSTDIVGVIFLLMYIFADSFTSQWQNKVYDQYGKKNVDQYQMMLGVNCFAIIFTLLGLVTSGEIPIVIEFLKVNPIALKYNMVTAFASATGQLFIFYTIKEFGPITFTIIMTTRQMFSIFISMFMFGHTINTYGYIGAILVFSVIFFQIHRKVKGQKSNVK